jgi:MFS family permease
MASLVGRLRSLILPIYLPMALLAIGLSAPVAILPRYLGSLGASVAIVGLVLSLRGFGNLVSDAPGGILLGRFRLRLIVGWALLGATAASVLLPLAGSSATVAISILLSGIATSLVVTASMTYVRNTVAADVRGRALSLVGGTVRIGALIGPILGRVLADQVSLTAALWLRGLCFGAAFLVYLVARATGHYERVAVPTPPSVGEQVRTVARRARERGRALVTMGGGILLLQLLRSSRTVVLPLWGEHLSLSATAIGAVMSLGSALDLLLFVPAGIVMDRAGRRVALSLCIGLFALGVGSLPFTSTLLGFAAASLLIGLGNGFGAGINMTIGTDLAPPGSVSEFIGMWRVIGDVGSTSGPAIVGALAAAVGLSFGIWATAGLGLIGLFVVAGFAPETLEIAKRDSQNTDTPTGSNPG